MSDNPTPPKDALDYDSIVKQLFPVFSTPMEAREETATETLRRFLTHPKAPEWMAQAGYVKDNCFQESTRHLLTTLENENVQLKQQLAALQMENAKLKNKSKAFRANYMEDKLVALQSIVDELTRSNKEIRAHNDGLDKQLWETEKQLEEANKALEISSRELVIKAQQEAELGQVRGDRKYLAEQNASLQAKLDESENELKRRNENYINYKSSTEMVDKVASLTAHNGELVKFVEEAVYCLGNSIGANTGHEEDGSDWDTINSVKEKGKALLRAEKGDVK